MTSTYYRLFWVARFLFASLALIFALSLTNVSAQEKASSDFNFAECKAKAEQGDAESQLIVGLCYSLGEGGVKQDDKEALKWLQMSAKQKNYQAQYILSVFCMEGRGLPKNEELGKKLLINASNGGYAEAQFEYASLLFEEKKTNEAIPLLKKSADQGFVPAQTALGSYYVNTLKAGSKEFEEGLTLLSLAAAQGDVNAQMTLGGTLVDQKKVSDGVVWLEIAGMNGEKSIPELLKKITITANDCYEISSAFFLGDGIIPKSYEKFKYWGERAIAQGNTDALFTLGVYYFGGCNHEQNLKKGIDYLTKAADQGNAEAQALLAIAYRNGRGVPKD
ncbi:MAG: sel1 repeat family protein, partial [Thermoguttaceae bacterium]|nr:sel1 repeat family protein [Thermoguttaceae bacterium]